MFYQRVLESRTLKSDVLFALFNASSFKDTSHVVCRSMSQEKFHLQLKAHANRPALPHIKMSMFELIMYFLFTTMTEEAEVYI